MSADKTQVGGDHYVSCAIQPIDYIEKNGLGFLEGCVLKRITRHNRSGGKGRQDIEKAIHELQLLLERRYTPKTDSVRSRSFGSGDRVTFRMPQGQTPVYLGTVIVARTVGGNILVRWDDGLETWHDPKVLVSA